MNEIVLSQQPEGPYHGFESEGQYRLYLQIMRSMAVKVPVGIAS